MVTPPRPPSIDRLARSLSGLPHPLLVDAARAAVAAGDPDSAPAEVRVRQRRLLQPVVNATGVLLHTNLGRAPLAVEVPARYANLELDLATGRRGDRSDHAGGLLALACGAEAVHVVNNGAAAVLLALAALARGRDVVVSRGEEVEIGGGFRIPEVMATSGARLVEVGTTNRTRVDDYRAVVDDPDRDVAALLKVHRSNYTISGFTEEALRRRPGGPRPARGGGPGLRAARRGRALAGGRAAAVAAGRARRAPDAGGRGRGGDLLRGQAPRRPAGRDHRRPGRPGGGVRPAPPGPGAAPRRAGAGRPAGGRPRLPAARQATRSRSGRWPPCRWRISRPGRRRWRRRSPAPRSSATASVTGGGTLPGVEIPSAGIALGGDHLVGLREHDPPVIARVERTEGR
jgi:L-seryl-tRNA(Ser) seleniumtransferase